MLCPTHERTSKPRWESQDKTLREDFEADSQYLWPDDDELNIDIRTDEEMKDIEMCELEMDNVFMSLIQDFGEKCLKEPWVAVGTVLKAYTHRRSAQLPLKLPPLETQFIVVLKGIGAETYKCLKEQPPRARQLDIKPAPKQHKEVFKGAHKCKS